MFKIDMFKPDDIYNQHFMIVRKIADGGQAAAYLVLDTLQMKQKVLKVAGIKPANKQKIKAQYKLICSFDHPNIIKAYSSQEKQIKGIPYLFIIMEYAEGGELKDYIGKLQEKEIFMIYHQIKSVIQYIHEKGVIHRDLTLTNILLDDKKNVKIIDFGIASQFEQQETELKTKFRQANRFYRPLQLYYYQVTKQNDLWQFGITLIQLAAGMEIMKLTDNNIPCLIQNFPEQVFLKYNLNNKFRSMISPLLIKEYKNRKFCEDIFWIDPIVYETTLKLMKMTDIQLKTSIKQHHFQNLLQLVCVDSLLTDESGKTIRLLNKLQKLQMTGNNLTDEFTYHIESVLHSLITLKLAFTDIRDESISLITKKSLMLEQLDISYTLVTSAGIIMLTKLTKLSSLAIWSSQYYYPHRYEDIINNGNNQGKYKNNKMTISHQCIKQLCKLNLTEICNNANGRDIDELILRMRKQSRCVQVRGRMSSKVVEYICEMEKLQEVYLYEVKEFEIKEFRSIELRSCGLVNCNIEKNKLIKQLVKCNKMTSLKLENNNIGKQGAIEIAKNMKSLTSLNLSWNDIGNQGAIEIAKNMKSLTSLHLDNNNISNQGAIEIAKNMKSLTSLDLNNNTISNQGAIEIAKNMKSLTSLDLDRNNISNQGAIEIAKNMKSLTSLNLSWNDIGNQGAIEIAKNMKSLTSLDLNRNNISNQGAIEIAKNMKSLTSLHLDNNTISNQGAIEIAKNMKSLTSLHLDNNNISNQGAIEIAKNMKSLTSLDLNNNTISNQGAIEIAKNMKSLTSLVLWNNNIDIDTQQFIKKMIPTTSISI